MFQFNFGEKIEDVSKDAKEENSTKWLQSEEITIEESQLNSESVVEDACEVDLINLDAEVQICHISVDIVTEKLKEHNNTLSLCETNKSDLLTAVYEGGLKVWECTYDLAKYLIQENVSFENKNVLDLGCGTGVLGVYCFSKKAQVYFQDYNPEVIKQVTIPNVILNTDETNKSDALKCKFFSGDWQSFLDITEDVFNREENKFDYILTSETIYNPNNYKKLLNVFKKTLKRNGCVFLAAKTHYFGVGGSLREFEKVIAEDFEYSTCWKCIAGVTREILKLSFKN